MKTLKAFTRVNGKLKEVKVKSYIRLNGEDIEVKPKCFAEDTYIYQPRISYHDGITNPKLVIDQHKVVYKNKSFAVYERYDDRIFVVGRCHIICPEEDIPPFSGLYMPFSDETIPMYFAFDPQQRPNWKEISIKNLLYTPLVQIADSNNSINRIHTPLSQVQIEKYCRNDILRIKHILGYDDETRTISFINEILETISHLPVKDRVTKYHAVTEVLKSLSFTEKDQ